MGEQEFEAEDPTARDDGAMMGAEDLEPDDAAMDDVGGGTTSAFKSSLKLDDTTID